jgi:ribosomal protein S18 acetylase RimI-like enzyme
VAVLPSYRQRGIGAAIMRYMEQVARSHNQELIRVNVRMSLPGNLTFYQGLGYQVIEVVDHPKGPDRFAVMVKRLEGAASL